MWMFTRYGMYSVACAWKDGRKVPDSDVLMVRSRAQSHLENLADRFPVLLNGKPILEDAEADYRYRLIVPKETWVEMAEELTREIDYCNFKDSVRTFDGSSDYKRALLEVWSSMHELQEQQEKGT